MNEKMDNRIKSEFKRYELTNFIKTKLNRGWGFLEKHGFPGIVDAVTVGPTYAGKHVLGDADTNEFIRQGISGDKGFMAARFGAVELNYIYYYLLKSKMVNFFL